MTRLITKIAEDILELYSTGDYFKTLLSAREIYTKLTGKLNEEDVEYESRMNLFNDWYVFNYRAESGERLIDKYILDHSLGEELEKSLLNIHYSLFEYKKKNLKKEVVLFDILHDEKVTLSKESDFGGLIVGDIFIGRVALLGDKGYFLKGVCTLPSQILGILKKESKKLRKLNDSKEDEKFLLKLEKLKIKSKNYGHVEAKKIFSFND